MDQPDASLEIALAELLVRSDEADQDQQRQSAVLEELVADFPQHAEQLREFWLLHRHFALIGDHAAGRMQTAAYSDFGPAPGQDRISTISPTATQTLWNVDQNLAGRMLGPYELIEEIDRGGMGVVYKARHQHIERTVALKIIISGALAGPEELRRFRSETEAAGRLSHPSIVPVFEVGQADGLVYFTMPYIEGHTLLSRVSESPLSVEEAVRVVYQLCKAVHHAHTHGILHRDLKPGNVLINERLHPVIIDFGLAKFAQRDSDLTTTGQILGTPAYMAPEQASGRGHQAECAADIYSLGAILYFLLSGQPPFTGPTAFDILLQVMDREPPAPSKLNRKVSRDLDYLCSRAMAKKPPERYASAADMAADLERYLKHEPLDLPHYSLSYRFATWWRRSPILVSHVCGIGAATVVAVVAHMAQLSSSDYSYQMILLLVWLAASFALQWLVFRAKWRDVGCLLWATVDVVLFTWLVFNADSPRTLLLIGYPMMIGASSLFYRTRFVIYMTTICVIGFVILQGTTNDPSLARPDFCAIFVSGLLVIGLTMHAMIRRIRGMSLFYEGG